MAKFAFLISLLFFLLTVTIIQSQGDHALAGDGTEMLPNSEPSWAISSRSPHTYCHSKATRKGTIATQKPAEMSWEALISVVIARLMEEFHVAVDISSRTFAYFQAAREYERMVGGDLDRRAYLMKIQRTKSNPAGSTRSPESRTLEIEIIAGQAGLRYEDVPDLALYFEGTVRQVERYRLATSKLFLIYTTLHPWGRLLVGWGQEKLTFGCAWIFGTCVLNTGTGCRPAIKWTVILSLAGPICALVHMGVLVWKR